MICKITFTVNGISKELSLETDSASPLTDLDIITVLLNNLEYCTELGELIRTAVINSDKKVSVTVDKLRLIDGLIGNCDLEFLRNQPQFAIILFPPENVNILLLDNLRLGGINIHGRIINSLGKELFIIRNDRDLDDVKKLAKFLNVRKLINELGFALSEDSKYYEALNEILKLREGIKDFSELILDFMYNLSLYRKIYINNNGKQESAIGILSSFIRTVKDWAMPTSYDNPTVNEINLLKDHLDDGKAFLSYESLYNILKTYDKELLDTLKITSVKSMKDYLSRPISETQYKFPSRYLISENDKNGYSVLLNNLFITEPDFTYRFLEYTNKGVILLQQFSTLELKYGFGYDTISSMDIINPDYKGYKIYRYMENEEANPIFFVSRGYLTELNSSKSFKTEKEAIDWIENSLRFLLLYKNSLIEFKFRDSTVDNDGSIIYDNSLNSETIVSKTSITTGQVIEVLDIPINKNTNIIESELDLIINPKVTMRDFINTVKLWDFSQDLKNEIISKINTPEKAITLIYKVNEILKGDRSNEDEMHNIIRLFNTAGVNSYFIENKSFISNSKGWSYRIIPTTPNIVTEYKLNKGAPVITWMQAISLALSNQFGVKVHLVTASEISELLSNVADPNTDKAFIYNGEVYVNTTIGRTTDLLHEYVHLILGVLKANPDLRENYELLMHLIITTTEGEALYNTLQETYLGLSLMDIMEEVFAKLFSGYIRNNITMNTALIFSTNEDNIKNMTNSIFNTKITNIKDFYGKNPITIFAKFNKEVANILSKENLDFGQSPRIYSNYISKLIREGNIIEEC